MINTNAPTTNLFHYLLRGWAWLTVKNVQLALFKWALPFITMGITLPILMLLNFESKLDIFSKSGLIFSINSLITTLPGFFIAALAAIVSFPQSTIDQLMPNSTTFVIKSQSGLPIEIQLTRRRFLSLLFSFLTAQSLLVCGLSILAINFSPSVAEWPIQIKYSLKVTFVAFYMFSLFQIAYSSLLALYYLGDKIHHTPE